MSKDLEGYECDGQTDLFDFIDPPEGYKCNDCLFYKNLQCPLREGDPKTCVKKSPLEQFNFKPVLECKDYKSLESWENENQLQQLSPDPEPENYKRKPLIYHMGLSAYYYKCPYCKAENSEQSSPEGTYCGVCGKYFDGVIEKKSKELIECEKQLGAGGGAVYKDDKGNWHYSDLGNPKS